MLAGLLLSTWEIAKPIHLVKIDEWAPVGFTCGILQREPADGWGESIGANFYESLLDSEIDDGALGDRAGGGFDSNGRRAGRRGWDEDIAGTGTTC